MDKPHIHAMVSAKVIEALAPIMREADEYANSLAAHCRQEPTQLFGAYLIPQERGVIVAVFDHCRMLAVFDDAGSACSVIKFFLPSEMLDAATVKTVELHDENGLPFMVEMEPKPRFVSIHEGFGMVSVEDTEKWGGVIGTWFNGDAGNVIKLDSYRAEIPKRFPNDVLTSQPQPSESMAFDPAMMSAICHAAKTLQLPLILKGGGNSGPIHISSADNEKLFGVLMPLGCTVSNIENAVLKALLAA